MAIICEECGKIYSSSETDKLNRLVEQKGKIKVRCTECGYVFTHTKNKQKESVLPDISEEELLDGEGGESEEIRSEEAELDNSLFEDDSSDDLSFASDESTAAMEETAFDSSQSNAEAQKETATADKSVSKKSETEIKGIGLRGKMFILFLVVPLVLMAISGYFSQNQLSTLANELNVKTTEVVGALASDVNKQSTDVVRQLAEDNISDKARAVALQCMIYIASHPELKKENFYDNSEFKAIALQSVGRTGYTVLIDMAEKDEDIRILVHETPMLIGVPAMQVLKEALGEHWPHFYNSLLPAKTGKEVKFYYKWKEEDGSMREKFMAISPVKGMKYVVLATTYIDEFTGPITKLESYYMKKFNEENKKLSAYASKVTIRSRNITLGILIITLLIVGLTITIYGHKITQAIKQLTIAADRISVGELEAEIKVVSGDEIGKLADAVSRMQDSLRVSIERLRRRK